MDKIILAIETSCDETAISIIKNNKQLLSNVVSSQIKNHSSNGGVVPELASRLHLENIDIVFNEALAKANLEIKDIDKIAVIYGPGLIGALHVGLTFAKSISYLNNIPLVYLNHMAAHIYACNLVDDLKFPLLALVVSGGHTELVYMKEQLSFEIIGQTQDDAIGECYDKVAKAMDLGYPGGPIIDSLAKNGKPIYDFPISMKNDLYNFSYSGLKSSVLNKLNQLKMTNTEYNKEDIAASFQVSAIKQLMDKTINVINNYPVNHFVLAGGVAANSYLREESVKTIESINKNIKITLPPLWCCTDNAAMVASLASFYQDSAFGFNFDKSASPNLILKTEEII